MVNVAKFLSAIRPDASVEVKLYNYDQWIVDVTSAFTGILFYIRAFVFSYN